MAARINQNAMINELLRDETWVHLISVTCPGGLVLRRLVEDARDGKFEIPLEYRTVNNWASSSAELPSWKPPTPECTGLRVYRRFPRHHSRAL